MASETASSPPDEEAVGSVATAAAAAGAVSDKRGKHRILAEVKRLEQDTKFLEVNFSPSATLPHSLTLTYFIF